MNNNCDQTIKLAAELHLPNVDWRLFKAQLWQESRLKSDAVSPAGAKGIAQFMPATWEEMSEKAGFKGENAFNPMASIFTGAFYMARLIKSWEWERPDIDRHCLALASYNAGLSNIIKAQKIEGDPTLYAEIIKGLPRITDHHSVETINYVKKILAFYNEEITGKPLYG
jgi:soluble lytic murein transglycosylase-like protein